jgi:D-3-phosphoglycerate dehydrogenase
LDALRLPPARELRNKHVGIVGLGRIGTKVGNMVAMSDGFWNAYDPYVKGTGGHLPTMFREMDAIVICCTYNKETHHMIGAELLRSMKQGAALINTSRGEVIDEYALAMVMEERPDLRVAVDVLEGETTGTQNPARLISRGAIVTPHVAGETYDSRTKAAQIILNLLKRELD